MSDDLKLKADIWVILSMNFQDIVRKKLNLTIEQLADLFEKRSAE